MEKIATNVKKLTKNSQKFDEKIEIRKRCKGVISALCRSWRELSNEYLLAKFDFDTAENEPI